MKKKIILLLGDPNSINSELIFKVWRKISNSLKRRVYLISSIDLFAKQLKKLNHKINFEKVENIDTHKPTNKLKILDLKLNFKNPFNVPKASATKFVIESLNLGHKIALRKDFIGLINCPINKNLLNRDNLGVTELLASKCNIKDNSEVMMLLNNNLLVSPITTHIRVKNISRQITKKRIIKKVITINSWYKSKFKKKPKIGLLGLNPHNGEIKKNSEEYKIIIPSIKLLRKKSIKVSGPHVADTLFIKDFKKYDVIVGMFHDQILIPFKTLFKFDAINLTLGLKYLRVSPDHGTASNLIGKNRANYISLLKCFTFISRC